MKLAIAVLVIASAGGACGGGGSEPPQPGAFTLGWSITSDSAPASCQDVGGITVQVTIDQQIVGSFACFDNDGATEPQDPGTYEILVELLAGDLSRLTAFAPIEGTIIDGPVDLGDFAFAVGNECDASTCAFGCCDGAGDCIEPQADTTCGRGGATCTDCTQLGQICNTTEGMCIE